MERSRTSYVYCNWDKPIQLIKLPGCAEKHNNAEVSYSQVNPGYSQLKYADDRSPFSKFRSLETSRDYFRLYSRYEKYLPCCLMTVGQKVNIIHETNNYHVADIIKLKTRLN